MGFVHTFLVMVQGSLMFQKVHLNKYWRLLLECWVWFHGFSVALMVAKGNWWEEVEPFMFGVGFGTLFFVTQLYGLPFWKSLSPYLRVIPAVVWFVAITLAITLSNDVANSKLFTFLQIPMGQWGCALIAWCTIYLFSWCIPKRYYTTDG